MEARELKAIIEAIIYVADEPVTLDDLKRIFPEESEETISAALAELVAEFNSTRGLMIAHVHPPRTPRMG